MPADGLCIILNTMWLSCDHYLGNKYSPWDPLICHSHQEKTGPLACALCVGILTKYMLTEWRQATVEKQPFYPLGLFESDNANSSTQRGATHVCTSDSLLSSFIAQELSPCSDQHSVLVLLNRTVLVVCMVNVGHMRSEKRSFHLSQNVCIFCANKTWSNT